LSCSFILRIVYSVLHIFVLLPHVANKLNHNTQVRFRLSPIMHTDRSPTYLKLSWECSGPGEGNSEYFIVWDRVPHCDSVFKHMTYNR